jgi:hypothetical protein
MRFRGWKFEAKCGFSGVFDGRRGERLILKVLMVDERTEPRIGLMGPRVFLRGFNTLGTSISVIPLQARGVRDWCDGTGRINWRTIRAWS